MPLDPVGVLVSGGLDSCILVGHLLSLGHRVHPFHIRSDTIWQAEEESAARRFLAAVRHPQLQPLVTFDVPLADVYGGHWSLTGRGVPGAEAADDAVYLPGRNALLLMKPAVWCQLHGIRQLALAPLASSPFSDAKPDFFTALETALNRPDQPPLGVWAPFAGRTKTEVMQLGRHLPLELTFSCLAPRASRHCGQCNKCGERQAAFRSVGRCDQTPYAYSPHTPLLPQPSPQASGHETSSGSQDSSSTRDTGSCDTGSCDTGSCDTGSCDTGSCDTGSRDTGGSLPATKPSLEQV